ncbi:MAG: DUF1343 domain-containing protein [Pseudomonadota bacterium]|nr:DUF1343 domain-containing protein [Pseudomonadota bacterium]
MTRFLAIILLLLTSATTQSATLQVGAEQPERYLPLLAGKKVGLVVNQTSRVKQTHLVDFLVSRNVAVQAVFAPEHGFRGKLGAGEKVTDGIDSKTGLPIRSLYGKYKKPDQAMLSDIDLLVFDIQDVGARFYTYISTLHYVLEAAAEQGIEVIVLDRPNPNGRYVDGPLREAEFTSFVSLDPLPLLHGLTVGELAAMIKGEAWINQAEELSLTVIPVAGYSKTTDYELPVAPSPNLPNSTAIRLYPSLCLFEATVVSVGRGTAWPFQVIGHNEVTLGDFTFTPQSMPESAPNPKLKGELLFGRDLRDSVIEGFNIELLYAVYQQFEEREQTFIDRPDFFDLLSGTDKLRKQLSEGLDPAAIRATWQPGLNAFKAQRQPYLLYPQ